ncbi:T9SS type A sorting domain-containing protein [Flavobacteriales bacterium]|nr:T9SS type A sorting domain-containing protein [Flavobacteriales bacterium]
MRKIIVLLTVFISFATYAQEELQPLRYNGKILKEQAQQKVSVLHESFTYIFDTLDLPFFDDFSKNHFKTFNDTIGGSNVEDSTWFLLEIAGVPDAWGSSYMLDTSYRYEYDTVPGYGFDSISIDTIALSSSFVDVFILDNYPVTFSNTEVWPSFYAIDSLWTVSSPDATIIEVNPDLLQDSLTMYFVLESAADADVFWQDRFVYLNDTYPIQPHSIGVATFDGIDDIGYPYDWSSPSATGLSDVLTSKPINLLGTVGDVYFSFLYQGGGIGEAPDQFDSLTLEFWSPVTSQWFSVWNTTGSSSSIFNQVLFEVTSAQYKQDGFQFRFKSYGSLTGSLDHWHIDYVELSDNRAFDDFFEDEWAFQYPAPSFIKEYTSMPWTHYQVDPKSRMVNDSVSLSTYSSNPNLAGINVSGGTGMELYYDGILLNSIDYLGAATVSPLATFDLRYELPDSGPEEFWFDTAYADTFAVFDLKHFLGTDTDNLFRGNDTLWQEQIFENYYAYDDGSAESAYGIVGSGAELAYKFTMPNGVVDSLRAVKMHFEASVNDASSELFYIQIWNEINGEPGDLIYTTDDELLPTTYLPKYKYGVNGYFEYVLPENVALSGTFYVGWKQSSAERLNIGFDKNINNQDKIFYDMGSGWTNTSFEGSLMIRPVFVSGFDDILASVNSNNSVIDFEMYPNPANDLLNINVQDSFEGEFKIYDMQGKLMLVDNLFGSGQCSITDLSVGMYIFQIISKKGDFATSRLSVSR